MTEYSYPILNDEVQLPFYVTGIGAIDTEWHVTREDGFLYNQIIFCVRGQGKLVLGDKEYTIEAGQGFYLPKNVPHEYYATQDIWENHWVSFDGSAVDDLMKAIEFNEARVFEISNISAVDALFKKLLNLFKTNYFFNGFEGSYKLYQFLIELHRYVNLQAFSKENYKVKQLQPVVDYIDNNFKKNIELKDLAATVDLSPQYLCRLFRECFNLRPFEYLARKRIQEAKRLLIEGNKTINEIALEIGYCDCSYFCAVFKKHEMLSPVEFRNIHKR